MNKSCALVLAAGFSTRYGADKRVVSSPPMILKTLQMICNSFEDVYVVHRAYDPVLLTLLKGLNVTCIPAPVTELSLGTSISTGVRYIQELKSYDVCGIFLADMPYIGTDTISNLLNFSNATRIVRPKYNKKEGHPVLFGKKFFDDLIGLKGKKGAYSVIERNASALCTVKVNDRGSILDIDCLQDREKMRQLV